MARIDFDAIVVGGGVVGAAAALALADGQRRILLLERNLPTEIQSSPDRDDASSLDLRVFAIAPGSRALLDRLGAWRHVAAGRHAAYARMRIWDAAGEGELQFNAADIGAADLGVIVEQSRIAEALWFELRRAPGVEISSDAVVSSLQSSEVSASLELADGRRLTAAMLVAADGAGSRLRQMAGIEVAAHDYHQRGLVAYIDCEHDHQDTAWQRFLPGGPLAFLPFSRRRCSIVWSQPEDEAERRLALDEEHFCAELERAFDGRLGMLRLASKRAAFPLRRQIARSFVAGRLLLIGDAAHAVHPLAGQGANLGLQDVAELQRLLQGMDRNDDALRWQRALQRYDRRRRSDATIAAHSFGAINSLFSNDAMLLTLLRGPTLEVVNRMGPLKTLMAKHAAG